MAIGLKSALQLLLIGSWQYTCRLWLVATLVHALVKRGIRIQSSHHCWFLALLLLTVLSCYKSFKSPPRSTKAVTTLAITIRDGLLSKHQSFHRWQSDAYTGTYYTKYAISTTDNTISLKTACSRNLRKESKKGLALWMPWAFRP